PATPPTRPRPPRGPPRGAPRPSSPATTTSTPRPTSWTPTAISPTRPSPFYRRSGSNETRPENQHPELLQFRQGLPAHVPAHGATTLAKDDRGVSDQPGMLP